MLNISSKQKRTKQQRTGVKAKAKGRQLFTNIQQILVITIVSTVGYSIFAPLILYNVFDILQANLFPTIASNRDFYGITAYLIFFVIHVIIVRIFIQDNFVFSLGIGLTIVNLALYIFFGQFLGGYIAFIFGENFQFDIQFLNLLGLIIMYDILFVFFSFVLLRR